MLLAVPGPPFSRGVYVDENALQPGQVKRAWDWDDVHYADRASDALEAFARANDTAGRIAYLCTELERLGLETHTQNYTFHVPHGAPIRGTNVYARMRAPRIDGREATVLAASWLSRWKDPRANGTGLPYTAPGSVRAVNVRGVAITLALARRLSMSAYWSKDLFVVLSDGLLDGMQAWATTYFAKPQPTLVADEVFSGGAQIWNAVALDYPADSYSSLSLLHEGRDAQLPNLDTLNSVTHILQGLYFEPRMGLHGVTYEEEKHVVPTLDTLVAKGVPRAPLTWLEQRVLTRGAVHRFLAGWRALAAQWRLQLAGHPSGVHGVLLPFHVDALTLFAEPAPGPLGFHDLGGVVELTLRAFSNLHERLHHSQFFYLLLSPRLFVPIGTYLVVPLLLGAALTLTGLALWNALGARRDRLRTKLVERVVPASSAPHLERPVYAELERDLAGVSAELRGIALRAYCEMARPVWSALACIAVAHAGGLLCLAIAVHAPIDCAERGWGACHALLWLGAVPAVLPWAMAGAARALRLDLVQLGACVQAFALLHAGMVVSVLSTLNFAQATTTALLLTLALYPLVPPWGMQAAAPITRGWAARVRYLVGYVRLVLVTPVALVALVALAVSWAPASHTLQYVLAQLPATIDLAAWDYHVLRASALHIVLLGYLPVVVEGAAACCLYVLAV